MAAVGDAIEVTAVGLNEAAVFFPTLGSLTPGATYLFGYQDAATGVVAMQSTATASGSWLSAATSAAVSPGTSAAFSAAAVRSLDIIASTTSGSAAGAGNAAAFDASSGSVMIDPTTTFTAGFLPTAMQVQAELPAGVDSAFVTPLVFAVGGTSAAPTYTLVGAATSQLLAATGVKQLPVEFAPSLLSGLSATGSYVMGFSTLDVQIATGGAITPTAAFSGVVGRAASTTAGSWLVSAGLGTTLAVGGVFAAAATGGQIGVSAGRTYACTFLTNATQAASPSGLASLQYAGGLAIDVSYADIATAAGELAIEAEAINAPGGSRRLGARPLRLRGRAGGDHGDPPVQPAARRCSDDHRGDPRQPATAGNGPAGDHRRAFGHQRLPRQPTFRHRRLCVGRDRRHGRHADL